MLVLLHLGLGTWDFILTLIQKGGLCPLSLLPLMREFSVFMPPQGKEQLDRGRFSEGLQSNMENKKKMKMKTK